MNTIVRLEQIEISNLKNVRHGVINVNKNDLSFDRSNIIGLYGQNGSGKTAFVESLQILKQLLSLNKLPKNSSRLIYFGQDEINLSYLFRVINDYGTFEVDYAVCLVEGKDRLVVKSEILKYRESIKYYKPKTVLSKIEKTITIRNKQLMDFDESSRVEIMLANQLSKSEYTSFVFRHEILSSVKPILKEQEERIISSLSKDFNVDFHVIKENGLIHENILMLLNIHLKEVHGKMPYHLNQPMVLPKEFFIHFKQTIDQINIVLVNIIPDLSVIVNVIAEETMEEGSQGIRFELLSEKKGVKLPLKCESAGVLKIISILSTLIAVYNNENACVVIDELDSGIFEFLLGELVEIMDSFGRGQLFFTSHNLRVLEVLNKNNLWFTTSNPQNRFIKISGIKTKSNIRDMYIRTIQLGGEEEQLYDRIDKFFIKKSFQKARK
ncbi:MAG: AAA family ATPase [Candidatus Zophobacter franzmannii]|nr:AAA family ATPase [Candidatus Zophobacter franzmannii]